MQERRNQGRLVDGFLRFCPKERAVVYVPQQGYDEDAKKDRRGYERVEPEFPDGASENGFQKRQTLRAKQTVLDGAAEICESEKGYAVGEKNKAQHRHPFAEKKNQTERDHSA